MKHKKYTEIESLAQTREKFVKLRTVLKSKIYNILSANGIITAGECLSSEKGLNKALEYDVCSTEQIEIEVLIEQIRSLNKGIEKLEQEMTNKSQGMDGHKNLAGIKGIGDKKRGGIIECDW